ncbi:MAG: 2-amino-4-hydroxy-6-hydroxymethyldihydropteridine diphosphokinase [Deltaproteobacteria bacterium]|nr:2-amino-4-hydroxy-6-hydroxymethyldihydropteridine diphosphokinase [Deltaproteobacteria bacterium]
MPLAFISIGSNLGDRVENCIKAVREISSFATVLALSSIYETEPVGKEDQPYFINCVVKIETELSPSDLLASLQSVEDRLGRRVEERWGPRVIDLDIIFYNHLVIETEELTIPHPRAHLRRFVLLPLSEIAPQLVHPFLNVSISKLLEALKDKKLVVKVGEFPSVYSQKSTAYPQT